MYYVAQTRFIIRVYKIYSKYLNVHTLIKICLSPTELLVVFELVSCCPRGGTAMAEVRLQVYTVSQYTTLKVIMGSLGS